MSNAEDIGRFKRVCRLGRDVSTKLLAHWNFNHLFTARSDAALMFLLKNPGFNPKSLELQGDKVTNAGAAVMFAKRGLERLRLCDCETVNEALVKESNVGQRLRQLSVDARPLQLAMRNGYNGNRPTAVSDESLKNIAKGCSDFESLSLTWCRGVTDEGLEELVLSSQKMTRFCVAWSKVGDKTMQALAKRASTLRNLELKTCKDLFGPSLTSFLKAKPRIVNLILVDVGCSNDVLREIGQSCNSTLERLVLSDLENVTDIGFRDLALGLKAGGGGKLKSLHISHIKGITDEGLSVLLNHLTGLTDLEIGWLPNVSEAAFSQLWSNPDGVKRSLRRARIDGISTMGDRGLNSIIGSCAKLRSIECFNSAANEEFAKATMARLGMKIVLTAW